jgi:hypothetical protein
MTRSIAAIRAREIVMRTSRRTDPVFEAAL